MTEREAWKKIAKMWSNCKTHEAGHCYVVVAGLNVSGLCGCISRDHEITDKQCKNMSAKINKFRNIVGATRSFIWRKNKDGAKARVAFCRAMANGKPYTSPVAISQWYGGN